MPRVETTGSLGESLIWDCRAQVHARDPTPTLVHFLWTERNALKLPEPRGGSHSSFVHWEIRAMFRQPECLAMTLVVSYFPQYSHTPYRKKAQIPYLNTVIKLPTSNDSCNRAASHLLERLIQRNNLFGHNDWFGDGLRPESINDIHSRSSVNSIGKKNSPFIAWWWLGKRVTESSTVKSLHFFCIFSVLNFKMELITTVVSTTTIANKNKSIYSK